MTDAERPMVVAGASAAGLSAAHALRAVAPHTPLVIIGEEPEFPYQRPPLSKTVLKQDRAASTVSLRISPKLDAEWRLGCRATGLDCLRREIEIDTGERIPYANLVIATGAKPYCPARWFGREGVHSLRTLQDSLAIRARVVGGVRRVGIIGAGFIGQEVAASLTELEVEVTLIDALEDPFARILGSKLGRLLAVEHSRHGVHLKVGAYVTEVIGTPSVRAIRLDDGTIISVDLLIVAIGVMPATGWLKSSGLPLDDGVVCDPTCRVVGADGIAAAGDVARWPNAATGSESRIEHWENAILQGASAARNLLVGHRQKVAYSYVPYFWSDQFGHKIQVLGQPGPSDEVVLLEGSVETLRFVAGYRVNGRIGGLCAFNSPHRIAAYRRKFEAGQADAIEAPPATLGE